MKNELINLLQFQQIEYSSIDYQLMVELRRKELRLPLGINFTTLDLQKDKLDYLVIGKINNTIVCCCILTPLQNKIFKLRQMAVDNEYKGNGIGKKLIQYAESFAIKKGVDIIEMNARKTAIHFYEKCGYKKNGNEFLEVGIAHIKMTKKLHQLSA